MEVWHKRNLQIAIGTGIVFSLVYFLPLINNKRRETLSINNVELADKYYKSAVDSYLKETNKTNGLCLLSARAVNSYDTLSMYLSNVPKEKRRIFLSNIVYNSDRVLIKINKESQEGDYLIRFRNWADERIDR